MFPSPRNFQKTINASIVDEHLSLMMDSWTEKRDRVKCHGPLFVLFD